MSHQQSLPRNPATSPRISRSDELRTSGWRAWPTGVASLSDPRVGSAYGGRSWISNDRLPGYHSSRPGTFSFTSLQRRFWRYWPLSNSWTSSLFRHRPSRSMSSATKKFSSASTPVASTARFILLCSLWYTTSALSSNTGKAIMMQFRYPITLTIVQFAFVALYSLLFMSPLIRFTSMRMPTKAIISKTLPMGMFQVGGHMFSSMAISRIPVSTVHTIKVCFCRAFIRISSRMLSHLTGVIPAVHRGSVRPPVRRELLGQDIHLFISSDDRRYARMLL